MAVQVAGMHDPKLLCELSTHTASLVNRNLRSRLQDSTQDKTGEIKVLKANYTAFRNCGVLRERKVTDTPKWPVAVVLAGSLPELHAFLLGCWVICVALQVLPVGDSCLDWVVSKEGVRALFLSQAQFQILSTWAQQGHLEWHKWAVQPHSSALALVPAHA